jgi:hypothetical protein
MHPLQHNDEPVTRSSVLRRDVLVRQLAQQVARCAPPQVFGVHGEWGAGKTSTLLQLQRHLSEPTLENASARKKAAEAAKSAGDLEPSAHRDRVFTIWFEAWRYQHEPVPVIALIQEMRRQFGLAIKLLESGKAGGAIALKSLVGAFDGVVGTLGLEHAKLLNPQRVLDAAEKYDTSRLRTPLQTDSVRDFLCQAIDALLKGLKRDGAADPRVVVFIDDLDRCSSDAAYRLLEGLKVHLSLPNCVFVLGMNQGAVVDLLTPQFSRRDEEAVGALRAESYLEKLCANVWRLPPVHDPAALLLHWLWVDDGGQGSAVGDLTLQKALRPHMAAMARCLPPNPRKLKALANTLLMLWQAGARQALAGATATELRAFVFFAFVYQFHHGLYQRWALAPDFFVVMREWAEGKSLSEGRRGIFARLVRTAERAPSGSGGGASDSEKSPPSATFEGGAQSLFPEPGLHGLFWMTPWLMESGGGALATPTMFEPMFKVFAVPPSAGPTQ